MPPILLLFLCGVGVFTLFFGAMWLWQKIFKMPSKSETFYNNDWNQRN